MIQPIVKIEFKDFSSLLPAVRDVYVKNINEAILAARGNAKELMEWETLFRECRWMVSDLLGEALYGNKPENKETLV